MGSNAFHTANYITFSTSSEDLNLGKFVEHAILRHGLGYKTPSGDDKADASNSEGGVDYVTVTGLFSELHTHDEWQQADLLKQINKKVKANDNEGAVELALSERGIASGLMEKLGFDRGLINQFKHNR